MNSGLHKQLRAGFSSWLTTEERQALAYIGRMSIFAFIMVGFGFALAMGFVGVR